MTPVVYSTKLLTAARRRTRRNRRRRRLSLAKGAIVVVVMVMTLNKDLGKGIALGAIELLLYVSRNNYLYNGIGLF